MDIIYRKGQWLNSILLCGTLTQNIQRERSNYRILVIYIHSTLTYIMPDRPALPLQKFPNRLIIMQPFHGFRSRVLIRSAMSRFWLAVRNRCSRSSSQSSRFCPDDGDSMSWNLFLKSRTTNGWSLKMTVTVFSNRRSRRRISRIQMSVLLGSIREALDE